MTGDFEAIDEIRTVAIRWIGDELAFPYPQVLHVIQMCSMNEFAVLGVEVNKALEGSFYTEYLSGYDVPATKRPLPSEDWKAFVQLNNLLAEKFVREHPASAESFYLLATASLREFRQIEEMRKNGR